MCITYDFEQNTYVEADRIMAKLCRNTSRVLDFLVIEVDRFDKDV